MVYLKSESQNLSNAESESWTLRNRLVWLPHHFANGHKDLKSHRQFGGSSLVPFSVGHTAFLKENAGKWLYTTTVSSFFKLYFCLNVGDWVWMVWGKSLPASSPLTPPPPPPRFLGYKMKAYIISSSQLWFSITLQFLVWAYFQVIIMDQGFSTLALLTFGAR